MYNSLLPFAFDESIRSRYPIDSTNSASCADFSIEYLKKLSDVKQTRRPVRATLIIKKGKQYGQQKQMSSLSC